MAQPITGAQSVSPECALAVGSAISDYEALYLSRRAPEAFPERFLKDFGAVKCSKEADGFRIYFAPTSTITRGGGMEYLVGLGSFEVIERIFER